MATTGVVLPQAPIYVPAVPESVKQISPELYRYLQQLQLTLQQQGQKNYANDNLIVTTINSGTTGAFAISTAGHINVTSGIVISVTTT